MFIMYADSTATNVTVSPRLSYDNTEPSYTSNVTYTVGPGSGISNGTMTATVLCHNCRSWKGGSIDPTNTAANFLFASGPRESLKSNSVTANLQRHSSYGTFTMDLTRAVGAGQLPSIVTADTAGTIQDTDKSDNDFLPALHGALTIIAFVGLMPIGLLILRIMNSVKWHALNQSLSAAVALIGVFVGIYCGTLYNRSRSFNSAHQLFGLVITVGMVAQFILGFVHHRIYKKTLAPTKLAPFHIWLGRLVIPAGVVNIFLGFPLAQNSKYNWALLGFVLAIIIIISLVLVWKWKQIKRQRKMRLAVEGNLNSDSGSEMRPWSAMGEPETNVPLDHINGPSAYHVPR